MKIKLAVISVALFSTSMTTPLYAASYCECVDYVRNRLQDNLGVTGAKAKRGNAYTWGSNLVSLGLKWAGTPRNGLAQAGDVVIFQPSYGGGINKKYGHIAFVEKAYYNPNNKTWTLTYFGANQGGSLRSDANCSNVSSVTTVYKDFATEKNRTVSYYQLK